MDLGAYWLARLVTHWPPVAVNWVSLGQTESAQSWIAGRISHILSRGQIGDNQIEPRVEIFRFDWRAFEEFQYLCSGSAEIFVEIESRKGPGRVPSSAVIRCIRRIEWV